MDNKTLPFVPSSKTSKAAADSMKEDAKAIREWVYRLIEASGPTGFTDDELEQILKKRHQTISARRRELVLDGIVKDSGRVRPTRSKRNATVWIAVPPEEVEEAKKMAQELEGLRRKIKLRLGQATLEECRDLLLFMDTFEVGR